MKRAFVLAATSAFAISAATGAESERFSPEQIGKGAETFAVYCSPCHGDRMSSAEFFDLKTFPPDQRVRFINSVTNGKNAMPPWRGQLHPEDIDALWSYVVAGERDK
jgi:mono/diheme cytochrome c family protein